MTLKITPFILVFINVATLTTSKLTPLIVGGQYSKITHFPHSVYLKIQCGVKATTCGASILNQALLLTAAHCIRQCGNNLIIRAYTGSERKGEGTASNVISFKKHENYNAGSKANDISIMRLEKDLTLGDKVKRVTILKSRPDVKTAVVAGWGWIDLKGTKNNLLKHATQRVYSHLRCLKIIPNLPPGTFCGVQMKDYPEKGDSGGALITNHSIQIGIVSFKVREISHGIVVYTDVSHFYDWIVKTASDLYCQEVNKKLKSIYDYDVSAMYSYEEDYNEVSERKYDTDQHDTNCSFGLG